MTIPPVPDDATENVFAVMERAVEVAHKHRVRVLMEAATAMALKLRLEGKMSTPEWDEMEKAINAIDNAAQVNMATIKTLGPAAIPPATIKAGAQRLQDLAAAMLATAAEHAVANGANPVPSGTTT